MVHFSHEKRAILRQVAFSWILLIIAFSISKAHAKCAFDAIFAFGDSNTDTGGFYAAFPSPPQPSPFGMTYFNRPTGRAADGRLYIDFLGYLIFLIYSLFACRNIDCCNNYYFCPKKLKLINIGCFDACSSSSRLAICEPISTKWIGF